MIDKHHVEELLRLNGVKATAPDEEIKSVLISARWHEQDVETALMVLRENKVSHQTHVERLNKVFTSDDRLQPELISSLLGVDVDLSTLHKSGINHKPRRTVSLSQAVQIGLISTVLSLSFVIGAMWYLDMGIFHFTMR
jgi:hypothetical protein